MAFRCEKGNLNKSLPNVKMLSGRLISCDSSTATEITRLRFFLLKFLFSEACSLFKTFVFFVLQFFELEKGLTVCLSFNLTFKKFFFHLFTKFFYVFFSAGKQRRKF